MRRPRTALWHRRWAGSEAAVSSPGRRSAGLAFSGRELLVAASEVPSNSLHCRQRKWDKTTLRLRKPCAATDGTYDGSPTRS